MSLSMWLHYGSGGQRVGRIFPIPHRLPHNTKTTSLRAVTLPKSDPGHWDFSPEWWGTEAGGWGRTAGTVIFQKTSLAANGVITVTAHPASSLPDYLHPGTPQEWRVLRFNGATRQSVARVSPPPSGPPRAWPHVLAFEYLKTMAAATAALSGSIWGTGAATAPLRVLCVGVGGGSLPLFLSHHFPHWQVTTFTLGHAAITLKAPIYLCRCMLLTLTRLCSKLPTPSWAFLRHFPTHGTHSNCHLQQQICLQAYTTPM